MLITSSCSDKNTEAIMQQAGSLLETNPDSAFVMLDSLVYSGKVDLEDNPEFALLYIQAKDKADKDISEDTDMLEVAKYFEKKNNPEKTALAYFYAGRVYKYQQKFKEAIQYCTKSLQYAQQTTNYNLLGLIHFDLGEIYSEELNIPEAKKNYLLARDYFIKAGNEKNGEYIYGYIGDMYLLGEPQQLDSALVCYEKALKKAFEEKDSTRIADINRLQASAYQEKKDYKTAQELILKSISYSPQSKLYHRILSENYLYDNQLDSALYYADKGYELNKNTNDKYVLCAIHSLYADIYKQKKNFELALNHHEQMYLYADSISENNQRQSILEIQKKYDNKHLENEKNELLLQRLYFVILFFVIIIIVMCTILSFRLKIKKQQTKLSKSHQTKFEIIQKIAQIGIKGYKEKTNLPDQIELDWEIQIYPAINELYNNFVTRLKTAHPHLSEKDILFCCLLRLGFESNAIAFYLHYENSSIRTMKMRLRKKLNLENGAELEQYLNNF